MSTMRARRTRAQLLRQALLVRDMMHADDALDTHGKPLVRAHRRRLRSYKDSFAGGDAVSWFIQQDESKNILKSTMESLNSIVPCQIGKLSSASTTSSSPSDDKVSPPSSSTREAGIGLFDDFLTVGVLSHVTKAHTFRDSKLLYRWIPRSDIESLIASSGQGKSLVPESKTTLQHLKESLLAAHDKMVKRMENAKALWELNQKPKLTKAIEFYEHKIAKLREKYKHVEETGIQPSLANLPNVSAGSEEDKSINHIDAVTAALESLSKELASLQAQQDEHKRELYFPDIVQPPQNADNLETPHTSRSSWAFRIGSEGTFMGAKNVNVETISAKWEMAMERPLGKQHAEITFRLRPLRLSVTLTDISVVSEPGSSVPSFSRELLAITVSASMNMLVSFIPKKGSSQDEVQDGKWHCKKFDFVVDEITRASGLTLPSGLLQWVINSFVPPKVKKSVTESLPPELALLIDRSNNLRIAGELGVFGIPASVMEYNLKLGKSLSTKHIASTTNTTVGTLDSNRNLHEHLSTSPKSSKAEAHSSFARVKHEKDASHRAALRLLSVYNSTPKSNNSVAVHHGFVSALHGHLFAKLRRRSGLAPELKALTTVFSKCSKWNTISNMAAYLRTVNTWGGDGANSPDTEKGGGDGECKHTYLGKILGMWQRLYNSFCAEDGLESLDLHNIFSRVQKISAQPLQITFSLTEVSFACNLGKALNAMRIISLRNLKMQSDILNKQQEDYRLRQKGKKHGKRMSYWGSHHWKSSPSQDDSQQKITHEANVKLAVTNGHSTNVDTPTSDKRRSITAGMASRAARIALGFEKVNDWYSSSSKYIKNLSKILSPKVLCSLKGQLLSGAEGHNIVDLGGSLFEAELAPTVARAPQVNMPERIDIQPSDQSLSLYGANSRYVIDLGVPVDQVLADDDDQIGKMNEGGFNSSTLTKTVDLQNEDVERHSENHDVPKDLDDDPLFLLELSNVQMMSSAGGKPPFLSDETSNSLGKDTEDHSEHRVSLQDSTAMSFAYGKNASFPDHERLIIVTLGTLNTGIRIDPVKFTESLAAMTLESGDGRVDLCRMIATPPKELSTALNSGSESSPSLSAASGFSYNLDMSCLPGTSLHINIQDFHIIASPLRLVTWVDNMVKASVVQTISKSDAAMPLVRKVEVVVDDDDNDDDDDDDGHIGHYGVGNDSDNDDADLSTKSSESSTVAHKEAVQRGMHTALRSAMEDMRSHYLILKFNVVGQVESPDGERVYVSVSNKSDRDDGDDNEASPPSRNTRKDDRRSSEPALFFQNVYFVDKVIRNLRDIKQAFTE